MTKQKKSKDLLNELMRQPPTLGEMLEKASPFGNEDDRSCAIVMGADLDSALEEHIRRSIVNFDKNGGTDIFRDGGPLGTTSAKIKVGYAFGAFGAKTAADLERLRLIRNTFAHSRKPLTFETDAIAMACDELETPERFPTLVGKVSAKWSGPRRLFMGTCTLFKQSFVFIDYGESDLRELNIELHPLD